jgi:hypothetical protein
MRAVTLSLAGFVLAAGAGGLADGAIAAPGDPAPSAQADSRVPSLDDTGLTTCVDPSTFQPIACASTGQDGEFGRDVRHPEDADGVAGFAFAKVCNNGKQAGQEGCAKSAVQGSGPHDWGCTKDLVTGLTWELRTSDGSIRDASKFFSDFGTNDPTDTGGLVAAMNAQALCGATDWRLPSVTELFSLANFNRSTSIWAWIPDLGLGYDVFWTSELHHPQPEEFAWAVDISWSLDNPLPETVMQERDGRTEVTAARVVRGPRNLTLLVPNGDEVVDLVNHLSWRRCVEGMTWQEPNCVGTPIEPTWPKAFAHANAVAAATGLDWRIPNVKELQSIQALSKELDIEASLFPQTPPQFYWSSTGWGSIYYVNFGVGIVSSLNGPLGANLPIRLVRDTD